MSLILDALNKADRDRQDAESPPGLQSNHGTLVGNQNITGWKKTAIIVVATLVLVAAAIAYYIGKQSGSPQPTITHAPAETTKPQPVAEAPQTIAGKVIDNGNKTAASTASQTAETRALLQKRRIEQQYEQAREAKAQSATATPGASESGKGSGKIDALYQPADRKEASSSSTENQKQNAENQTKEPVISEAENSPENAADEPATSTAPAIGDVRDLPWSVQEKIPTLMYTEHSYTNSPNDFATINGERRKQGQKIGGMLTVESILPDGVVLRYESYQFKMPAFNSWVNM